MKRLLLIVLLACPTGSFAFPGAPAINEGREGEITQSPLCQKLINRSDQTIMGTIATAAQTLPSGDSVRHRENFRLEAGQDRQFCTTGPFYAGRRVEIVIRTIIPLFDCKTNLDRPIYLEAKPRLAMTKLTATCR